MFQRARISLTAWYLLILMVISILFSAVIYRNVSSQIEGLIHKQNEKIQHLQNDYDRPSDPDGPPIITPEELEDQKEQLLVNLIIVNGIILVLGGGASYFLAGRTLKPIKYMIDEQNQFISSASHELRTPIATMRAEMEGNLLEKHISDTNARMLIHSNLEELGTLQKLTNKLLQIAQIHTLNGQYAREKVLLDEIVAKAIKKVLPLAKKKDIQFRRKLLKVYVKGDSESLLETCVILFENAIKYSPEKTMILITMQTQKRYCTISVADQGIGIPSADLPHIFDRFYRGDKSRNQEGFGLGLSIAKKTIESHHGSIHVSSTVGMGTIFTISLPVNSS